MLLKLPNDDSANIGHSSGRQAPTTPSDDSTMGQYTVGVNRSASRH